MYARALVGKFAQDVRTVGKFADRGEMKLALLHDVCSLSPGSKILLRRAPLQESLPNVVSPPRTPILGTQRFFASPPPLVFGT